MACYLKQETYFFPSLLRFSEMTSELITFNHLICHSSSTALGTRTGYWKPTRRGTDEILQSYDHFVSCLCSSLLANDSVIYLLSFHMGLFTNYVYKTFYIFKMIRFVLWFNVMVHQVQKGNHVVFIKILDHLAPISL